MNHLLKAACIVAILGLDGVGTADAQDAYILGDHWYGHKVDSCYIDFDKIRSNGDPNGAFTYATRHVQNLTQFTHGQPVYVMDTREVEPDDVTLTLVRRVGESETYWTNSQALSGSDPLAEEKAKVLAAQQSAKRAAAQARHEKNRLEQEAIERARAVAKKFTAETPKRPVAMERYWQIGNDRFRGKLVNANETHVKLIKSDGETIIVNRQYLSETSDTYVTEMLEDLKAYQHYQRAVTLLAESA